MHVLLSIHRPAFCMFCLFDLTAKYPHACAAKYSQAGRIHHAFPSLPPGLRETEGNRTQHTCVLVPFLLFLLAYC